MRPIHQSIDENEYRHLVIWHAATDTCETINQGGYRIRVRLAPGYSIKTPVNDSPVRTFCRSSWESVYRVLTGLVAADTG